MVISQRYIHSLAAKANLKAFCKETIKIHQELKLKHMTIYGKDLLADSPGYVPGK